MISSSQSYNPPRLSVYSSEDEALQMSHMSSRHSTIGFATAIQSDGVGNGNGHGHVIGLGRPSSISIYTEDEMSPLSRSSSRRSALALDMSAKKPVDDSVTQFGLEDRDRTRTNSISSSKSGLGLDMEKQAAAAAAATAVGASTPRPVSSGGEQECSEPPPPPPPFQARFWSKDPVTSVKRKIYTKVMVMSIALLTAVIFGFLSIYWASLYDAPRYAHKLEGWVIDFDGGAIGQTVIQAFQNSTGLPQQVSWKVVDASQFPNFPQDVEDAVVGERTWAAISINPGVSNNLDNAIANADSTYNGALAVTAYVNEARNNNGYAQFIRPQVITAMSSAVEVFAVQNSQQIAANSNIDLGTLLSQAPGVVTIPLYYTINNLRPFDVPLATALQLVGLIYVLIIAFIVCMNNYQARVVISGLNQHLRLTSLLAMRAIIPFFLYFFVSLVFSLLSLAFQTPFDRYYGDAGFVIYWMMNWAGMLALGLAMESMITILTPAFISFFLVLWIISNVSVVSLPIEVLPGIFYYGYATPFFNISQAVKSILFNTKNHIGLNFGVQFAWIGISLVTLTIFTILLRKKEEREWLKKQQNCDSSREKA